MEKALKVKAICSILSSEDVDEAIDCIAQTFSQGEPMTSLLGISKEEFTYFAKVFITKAAREGMSVVARDIYSDQFMGCIICEDYVTDLPEGIEDISPNFNPIIALLESLGTCYKTEHSVNPGELYHLFMGGVYKEFAGSGVASQMSFFIEKLGKEKGYNGAIGEVTGPISQHVYINQLGYQPLYHIRYSDFLYEGKRIFKNITACEKCILIYKPL